MPAGRLGPQPPPTADPFQAHSPETSPTIHLPNAKEWARQREMSPPTKRNRPEGAGGGGNSAAPAPPPTSENTPGARPEKKKKSGGGRGRTPQRGAVGAPTPGPTPSRIPPAGAPHGRRSPPMITA